MGAKFVKEDAVLSLPVSGSEDHSDKKGYAVKLLSGAAALNTSATAEAFGVLLDGEKAGGRDSVAVFCGSVGTVRVKLSGTVALGARIQQVNDGTFVTDAGTGNRVIVGKALEAGVAQELIEAVLCLPIVL